MNITDTPLVSREVSQRTHEESKLKKTQQNQMEHRLVEQPGHAWRQSLAASKDSYISEALKRVRQSDVTLPTDLTMMHGTFTYTNK